MKKVITMLLVLTLITGVFGCAAPAENNAPEALAQAEAPNQPAEAAQPASDIPDEVTIALVGSISGVNAINGKYFKGALAVIQSELETSGGVDIMGKKVKVNWVIEDTEGKPEITANVYRKVIEQDNAIAICGPNESSCILAAGPIAQDAGIPAVGIFSTNEAVTQIGDYIFRACYIDPYQGKVLAQFAFDNLQAKTAAVLYSNADQYSKGLMENFKSSFEALGGSVAAVEAYGGSDVKDFNAQLSKIKTVNPDVLFMPNQAGELPLQIQQARTMGITATFLGGDSWDLDVIPEVGGVENVEGSCFAGAFSAEDPSEAAQAWVTKYEELNGEKPGSHATLAYEAMKIVLDGLSRVQSVDGASLRDAIRDTKDLAVPSGKINFDENRNPIKSAVILEYKNGVGSYVATVSAE